jgi:hypothetical protein
VKQIKDILYKDKTTQVKQKKDNLYKDKTTQVKQSKDNLYKDKTTHLCCFIFIENVFDLFHLC